MDLAVNPARSAYLEARSAFRCAQRTPKAREAELAEKPRGGRTRNLAAGLPGASRNGAAARADSTAHPAAKRLPRRCVSAAFQPIRAKALDGGFRSCRIPTVLLIFLPGTFPFTLFSNAHIER